MGRARRFVARAGASPVAGPRRLVLARRPRHRAAPDAHGCPQCRPAAQRGHDSTGRRLVPVTDDRLRTIIETPDGDLDFQTYYVRRGHRDEVVGIRFDGAAAAAPAPGVVDAIGRAAAIIVAPSNPLISIGPILAVPGISEALRARSAPCVAVSPIVGGQALRGPAAAMMRSLGLEPSPAGVAGLYDGLIDAIVIDDVDHALAAEVEQRGVAVRITDTIMRDAAARRHLAEVALEVAGIRLSA
jgi:LPPG:FO 2-phospho-L-lactate transferase